MNICIIGGGPSGMMAAIAAALNGNNVTIIEKNEKLGKKLYITGKGRCNVTNAGDLEDIRNHIVSNSKFMYSSLYEFSNADVYDFFENRGVKLKVERGNRVFPESDKSSDIIKALTGYINELGINVLLNTKVKDILIKESSFEGIKLDNDKEMFFDKCIVATGGKSYPVTGSDGDGYRWAENLGINIIKPVPSLVPFIIKEDDAKDMQGLSLRNIGIKILREERVIYSDEGELLFTHFGVSGPVILKASSVISGLNYKNLKLLIDLKPGLDMDMLNKRLLRDFEKNNNKNFNNSLNDLLPKKMIKTVVERSKIDPYKKVNVITREERQALTNVIKNLEYTITGLRGFEEAIITKGGIDTVEINPKNFESKKIKGLHFIGEVLDVDATTGGYNLQIAWSSGFACGNSMKDW